MKKDQYILAFLYVVINIKYLQISFMGVEIEYLFCIILFFYNLKCSLLFIVFKIIESIMIKYIKLLYMS